MKFRTIFFSVATLFTSVLIANVAIAENLYTTEQQPSIELNLSALQSLKTEVAQQKAQEEAAAAEQARAEKRAAEQEAKARKLEEKREAEARKLAAIQQKNEQAEARKQAELEVKKEKAEQKKLAEAQAAQEKLEREHAVKKAQEEHYANERAAKTQKQAQQAIQPISKESETQTAALPRGVTYSPLSKLKPPVPESVKSEPAMPETATAENALNPAQNTENVPETAQAYGNGTPEKTGNATIPSQNISIDNSTAQKSATQPKVDNVVTAKSETVTHDTPINNTSETAHNAFKAPNVQAMPATSPSPAAPLASEDNVPAPLAPVQPAQENAAATASKPTVMARISALFKGIVPKETAALDSQNTLLKDVQPAPTPQAANAEAEATAPSPNAVKPDNAASLAPQQTVSIPEKPVMPPVANSMKYMAKPSVPASSIVVTPPAAPLYKAEKAPEKVVEAAPEKPVDTQLASLSNPNMHSAEPQKMATEGAFATLFFAKGEKDLVPSESDKLNDALAELHANNNKRLNIVSYASEVPGSIGEARRISLKRALSVRKYVMSKNIDSMRINVQAMGDKQDAENHDRVDIFLIN